jgi:cell division protein ZapA
MRAMPEVNVEVNGRKYRMACEEGQEAHLLSLAERFNTMIEEFKGSFGEIGDNRLTVMAGISVLDELVEVERKLKQAETERDEIAAAGESMAKQADEMEARFTKRMEEVARRLELAASSVDGVGLGGE